MLVKKMDTAVARAHSAWLWVKDGCSLGASAGKNQHHALHTADAPFCRRGQWCAAQQQAREKETHGRQRCWAGGILGPGAACGGAPRTLGRASAAGTSSRRPTKPAFSFLGVHMQGCFYGQRGALKTHTVEFFGILPPHAPGNTLYATHTSTLGIIAQMRYAR